jgi:hypothetical protein
LFSSGIPCWFAVDPALPLAVRFWFLTRPAKPVLQRVKAGRHPTRVSRGLKQDYGAPPLRSMSAKAVNCADQVISHPFSPWFGEIGKICYSILS